LTEGMGADADQLKASVQVTELPARRVTGR
jgi:hypothetical protein